MELMEIFDAQGRRKLIEPDTWPEWEAKGATRKQVEDDPQQDFAFVELDYNQYKIGELRVMADTANIPYRGLRRHELIAELTAHNVPPVQGPDEQTDEGE